jgi:hypothetical protein
MMIVRLRHPALEERKAELYPANSRLIVGQ